MVLMPQFCLRTPLSSSRGHQRFSLKSLMIGHLQKKIIKKMPWQAPVKVLMALFPLKWLVGCTTVPMPEAIWNQIPEFSKLHVLLSVCQHCGLLSTVRFELVQGIINFGQRLFDTQSC